MSRKSKQDLPKSIDSFKSKIRETLAECYPGSSNQDLKRATNRILDIFRAFEDDNVNIRSQLILDKLSEVDDSILNELVDLHRDTRIT